MTSQPTHAGKASDPRKRGRRPYPTIDRATQNSFPRRLRTPDECQRMGTLAARFGNLPWRVGLSLGGSIWIAVLALAYSAGPIKEAVFWASLVAALPVGFGWICHYILSSKNGAADSTVVAPAGSRSRTEPAIAQAHKGPRISQQKGGAAVNLAPAVKPRSGFKSLRKSKRRAKSPRKRFIRR
jgi:hypothetical protein